MHELTTTDRPCADHKDCTATVFMVDGTPVGTRHLHQWLDEPGKHADLGRDPDSHVVAALNVGILLAFDPETGEFEFDPDAVRMTTSSAPSRVAVAARLNATYPVADDHRGERDKTGNYPKLRRPAKAPPLDPADL